MVSRWKSWPVLGALVVGFALGLAADRTRRHVFAPPPPGPPVMGDALQRQTIACPAPGPRTMVLLVVGQSHTANLISERIEAGPGLYEVFRGQCHPGRDPALGAAGWIGNIFTRVARKLVDEGHYDNVVVSYAAVSMVKVEAWGKGGQFHGGLEAATVLPSGLSFTHIVTALGTTDRIERTPPDRFSASYKELVGYLQGKAPGAPVFVSLETGYCSKDDTVGVYNPEDPIDKALRAIPQPEKGIFAGADLDRLVPLADRYDGCHMNASSAQRVTDAWVQAIAARKAGKS